MKLSTRARYALRLMIDVGRNGGENEPVSLASVSERSDLSRGYLEQLALVLRNAGLLHAVSGRHGGYLLAKAPAEITIGDIIEAVIGRINIVRCVDDETCCDRTDDCEPRLVYALINQRISEILSGYTLLDLLDSDRLRVIAEAVAQRN